MKTLKLFNYLLLVFAAGMAVTAVVAFANGDIIRGICILWIGCEVLFFLVNKKSIEAQQASKNVHGFLSAMDDTIEEYGSAIITENEDGKWKITAGERNTISCSAENNDNIDFVHIAEGVEE